MMKTTTLLTTAGLVAILALSLAACSKPAEDTPTPPADATATPEAAPVETATSAAAPAVDEATMKIIAALPAPKNTADLANGAKQFAKCKSCHTISAEKKNLTGPTLYGVYGRKNATVEGYTYSDAMKAHAVTWDFKALDEYIAAPPQVVKGTKMAFAGIKNEKDRIDLIAYLKVEGSK
jgi:cytochrome c